MTDKRTLKSMPEWVIYKNDQRLGHAITWHKALDNLLHMELIKHCKFEKYGDLFLIFDLGDSEQINRYKIVKER